MPQWKIHAWPHGIFKTGTLKVLYKTTFSLCVKCVWNIYEFPVFRSHPPDIPLCMCNCSRIKKKKKSKCFWFPSILNQEHLRGGGRTHSVILSQTTKDIPKTENKNKIETRSNLGIMQYASYVILFNLYSNSFNNTGTPLCRWGDWSQEKLPELWDTASRR
jgi:hypothetical protein